MPEEKKRRFTRFRWISLIALLCTFFFVQTAMAADPIQISYYYEEVCASCDGTKEFFELYNRVITSEEKQLFQAEISTYNVFMESCKEKYEEAKTELDIPSGTSLPVLIIEDQWISGLDNIEAQLHDILINEQTVMHAETESTVEIEASGNFWDELKAAVETEMEQGTVAVLFSTNGCEDCNAVKEWYEENKKSLECTILEYNIIENDCLTELKAIFKQYKVPEEEQKVPALFFGESYLIGRESIIGVEPEVLQSEKNSQKMLNMFEKSGELMDGETVESMNIWTLAAAGLLAGFNPCSISMLLMLMSLLLSEKASIWKSGLLYLTGKYVAYISIGMVIFMTASQISNQTMEQVGGAMQIVMGILFAVAAAFYIADAVRIHRQDYGNIKTQLPVGLRRMNHQLIKKVSSARGMMQPLMILVLGIVISFGEFFCTGQIYMASITYLLKDQVKAAIFPFLVYTTAMSIPAVIMILLIQRTRNTEAVSDFMFRHLGAIKVFNAALFIIFAIYFLVF